MKTNNPSAYETTNSYYENHKGENLRIILYDREMRHPYHIHHTWKSVDKCIRHIKFETCWKINRVYFDTRKTRLGLFLLLNKCKHQRIDLVYVHSISHLSRKLQEAIKTINKIKECGTGVYFQTEQFCTLDNAAEVKLSILMALAEEESRKKSRISHNTFDRFRYRQHFYGYEGHKS